MDPTFFDRACGCLMGLAIGDALGAPVEGMPPDRIKQQYGEVTGFFDMETAPTPDVPKPQTRFRMRGAYTDDTQMALCLLDSLVEAGGFEPVLVAESFCRLIGEKSDLPPDSRSSSNVRIGSSDLDPVNWPTLTFRIYLLSREVPDEEVEFLKVSDGQYGRVALLAHRPPGRSDPQLCPNYPWGFLRLSGEILQVVSGRIKDLRHEKPSSGADISESSVVLYARHVQNHAFPKVRSHPWPFTHATEKICSGVTGPDRGRSTK